MQAEQQAPAAYKASQVIHLVIGSAVFLFGDVSQTTLQRKRTKSQSNSKSLPTSMIHYDARSWLLFCLLWHNFTNTEVN